MEKDMPCKNNPKKARVAILIPNKTDFKTSSIRRGILHNDKSVHASGRYSNDKCMNT